tara:strand:+ start:411046 stop:411756 length:711 start_codon:yes stop_codon:yes gene_type:complete
MKMIDLTSDLDGELGTDPSQYANINIREKENLMSYNCTRRISIPVTLLACLSSSSAHGELISIDFDESFYPNQEPFVFLSDQLEPDYGISFSLVDNEDKVRWYEPTGAIFGGRLSVRDPFASPPTTHDMRIDFTNTVNFVELQGFDGQGGDIDILHLRAYNALDQLVAQSTVIDLFGPTGARISVLGGNISYIEIGVEAETSGLFYDNLVYNTIPAPASATLLALGFMGCRRKRNN